VKAEAIGMEAVDEITASTSLILTQLVEVVMCKSVVLKKRCHHIKRKAAPNSSNKLSICLQELLH